MKEYLKIALSDPSDTPYLYKKILAVTFTNKAAAEMKERILDALKNISSDPKSPIGKLISDELNEDPQIIANRSKRLLSQILHNYSDFSIGTIDAFTHKIVKTFAFDLKLPVNFTVETNTDEFYEKVVSDLLSKIGDDKELTDLLINFSVNNAGENMAWDPEPQLFNFTSVFKKEDAETHLNKLGSLSKDQLQKVHEKINAFLKEFRNTIKLSGNKAIDLIRQKQLNDSNFNYTVSGPQNTFKKWADLSFEKLDDLAGKRFLDAVQNNKWQNKNNDASQKAALESIVNDLTNIATETLAYIHKNYKRYALYKLVEKNIHSMILVSEMQQIASAFKQEEQVVFISEFNSKISKIVANEPAPFIYERLGERYHHFLLDEFQDTSGMQWQNILPLIDNSLSNGWYNLIVGDSKQSIYRWRNANIKQFNDLPNIENPDQNPIVAERQFSLMNNHDQRILETNYRSLANVVDFNNGFFNIVPGKILGPELLRVYDQQEQKKKHETGGYVSIQIGETEKEIFEKTQCDSVILNIQNALTAKFTYNDICIIVRSNYHGTLLARTLTEQKIPVISSESLLLKNNSGVNCIISFLKHLMDPGDKISAAAVINHVYDSGGRNFNLSEELKALKHQTIFEILKRSGYSITENDLYQKNVFDICVELITHLKLNETNAQYIRFFLDEVNDYLVNKTGSVSDLLTWWENRGRKASLIIPEGTDAVRIMTIHKSKGLEFPVVILPFVNWETFKAGNVWIDIEDDDIELTTGLFNTTNALAEGGFNNILTEEQNDQKLDNLNLLYVAFTRAIERLHIIALRSKTQKRENVANWISNYCMERFGSKENGFYEIGKPDNKIHELANVVTDNFDISQLHFNTDPNLIKIKGTHKLKLHEEGETAREKGIKMHYILSEINSENDVEPVLNKMQKQGLVSETEKSELGTKISELLKNSVLQKYFTGKLNIKNEAEIITAEGEILRPDKLILNGPSATIIDYKTGKQNTKAYLPQMNKYYLALQSMGYSNVKNILVYVEENIAEELN